MIKVACSLVILYISCSCFNLAVSFRLPNIYVSKCNSHLISQTYIEYSHKCVYTQTLLFSQKIKSHFLPINQTTIGTRAQRYILYSIIHSIYIFYYIEHIIIYNLQQQVRCCCVRISLMVLTLYDKYT